MTDIVLHAWVDAGGTDRRVVQRNDRPLLQYLTCAGEWGPSSLTSEAHASAAELARLAAENTELRNDGATQGHLLRQLLERLMAHVGESGQSEGALDVLVRILAERDRLRAHAGRARRLVSNLLPLAKMADWQHVQGEGLALLDDPDGQAAAEWLEAEKAKIRGRERQAVMASMARLAAGRREPESSAEAEQEAEAALAWLADREAKARAAGRRLGLAEAAEYCLEQDEEVGPESEAAGLLAAVAREIQALTGGEP